MSAGLTGPLKAASTGDLRSALTGPPLDWWAVAVRHLGDTPAGAVSGSPERIACQFIAAQ